MEHKIKFDFAGSRKIKNKYQPCFEISTEEDFFHCYLEFQNFIDFTELLRKKNDVKFQNGDTISYDHHLNEFKICFDKNTGVGSVFCIYFDDCTEAFRDADQ